MIFAMTIIVNVRLKIMKPSLISVALNNKKNCKIPLFLSMASQSRDTMSFPIIFNNSCSYRNSFTKCLKLWKYPIWPKKYHSILIRLLHGYYDIYGRNWRQQLKTIVHGIYLSLFCIFRNAGKKNNIDKPMHFKWLTQTWRNGSYSWSLHFIP